MIFSENQQIGQPQEYDTLSDGRPAYDLKISPQKPTPPKPEPVIITLVDKLTPILAE